MPDNDIKAPDGYLLGGLRLVRKDATLLFNRVYFDCPKSWIGQRVWVHVDDAITLDSISAAPPNKSLFGDWRANIRLHRSKKPEAKSLLT